MQPIKTDKIVNEKVLSLILMATAFAQAGVQYARTALGDPDLWFDAREVWIPLAQAVHQGAPLYQPPAIDNKPPLFELLNIYVYSTGYYQPAFFALVGLANATTVGLLIYWYKRRGHYQRGLLTGLLFLSALPLVNGTIINVRSFALVGIMVSLISHRPIIRGGAIAVAGLFSQFAVFAIPMLALDGWRKSNNPPRWFTLFVATGGAIVVFSFLPIWVIWGTESAIAGVEASFLAAGGYATGHEVLNPLHNPVQWLGKLVFVGERLLYILLPAVVGIVINEERTVVIGCAVLLSAPLVMKSLLYYWVLPLPFLAALASSGIIHLLQRQTGEMKL